MTTQNPEFEGKNTEEAINAACRHFNTTADKLTIEILSTGSTGIFGLVGSKKAKIHATLKKEEPPIQPPIQEVHEETLEFKEAKQTLERILSLLGIEATVVGQQEDDNVELTMKGAGAGILIGKKGSTLDAIQYIVNKVVTKNSTKKIKVHIDTGNYRQRHNQSLVDLALRLGEKAKKTGKPITISPMNPADRRVVHIALQNDRALKTKSKGEGLLKKIVIFPQKEGAESSTTTSA